MKIRTLRLLASTCLAILILNQSSPVAEMSVHASVTQGSPTWAEFAPPDEEITAAIPAHYTTRTYQVSGPNPRDPKRERVLAHLEYGGYGSGLIFIIHSYKAERPQRLTGSFLNLIGNDPIPERTFSFDGVDAKQYRSTQPHRYADFTLRTVRFTTKKHVYVVTLATLEENNNPAVDRFLNSLRLRKSGDQVTSVKPAADNTPTDVFSAKELTRRAIIVWKGEPFYTDEARAHRVTGTVILEAVFAGNGYVADITVNKGLKDGLTESAIDAARNIRFFPAEKDGKPVSQRLILEYNFALY
jgi:TonB family protein